MCSLESPMKTKDRKLAFDYVTINEIINLEKENTFNSKSKGFPEELGLSFDLGNNKTTRGFV